MREWARQITTEKASLTRTRTIRPQFHLILFK